MSAKDGGDDRSMSEILSSIRRIVTDEEKSRREAEEERRKVESVADDGAGVFVLTEAMHAEPAQPELSPTLDLSAEVDAPPAPEVAPAPAATSPLELGPAAENPPADDALELSSADIADEPAAATPFAAPPEEPSGVDFPPASLTEEDVEEIVRRIVREELQGPIGQQISRKVKRLIREEVRTAIGEDEDTLI